MSLFMWKEMYYDLKPCSNQIFHLLVFTYKVFFTSSKSYIYILHTFSQTYQDPSPLEIFPDNLDIHIL